MTDYGIYRVILAEIGAKVPGLKNWVFNETMADK
jgi:hypothetical protein